MVSRAMGYLRARVGRREGVQGFLTDHVINRVEKVIVMCLNTDEFVYLLLRQLTINKHLQ